MTGIGRIILVLPFWLVNSLRYFETAKTKVTKIIGLPFKLEIEKIITLLFKIGIERSIFTPPIKIKFVRIITLPFRVGIRNQNPIRALAQRKV